MRRSAAGWKPDDLYSLYEGFGFEIRYGSKHDVIKHPEHPELRAAVLRYSPLRKVYVKQAIELIEQLEKIREIEADNEKEGE
jgi:hypothetical protein